MKCKQCGSDLVKGQTVCSQCGATGRSPRTRRCLRCGARIPDGVAVCPQCGANDARTHRWLMLALSVSFGIVLGVVVFLALHDLLPQVRYDIGHSLLDASESLVPR